MKLRLSILLIALCAALGLRAAVVDTITIESKHLAEPGKAVIILPEAAKYGDKTFPTLYLLHGFSGNYTNWIKRCPELADYSDLYGMIIVMPDGRDSWYWDRPDMEGMQMESYFVNDLVPYIDGNYPTRREASQRAITGLSMGGHGALFYAIRHNDIWGSAGSMSGVLMHRLIYDKYRISRTLRAMGIAEDDYSKYTVLGNIQNIKPGCLNIIFDCGTDDFYSSDTRQIHEALLEAGIAHDYSSRPGGHSWKYWTNSIRHHLLFFHKAFNK